MSGSDEHERRQAVDGAETRICSRLLLPQQPNMRASDRRLMPDATHRLLPGGVAHELHFPPARHVHVVVVVAQHDVVAVVVLAEDLGDGEEHDGVGGDGDEAIVLDHARAAEGGKGGGRQMVRRWHGKSRCNGRRGE